MLSILHKILKRNPKISPTKLFSRRVLEFKVQTKKFGKMKYINLDNAATTPPLLAVEHAVENYMASYGSVHRGAGAKSKLSTDRYEESRAYIKEFVHAPEDSYVIFTENTTGAMNAAAYFFSFLKGKVALSAVEHSSSLLPWIKAEGMRALGAEQVELARLPEMSERIQILGRGKVLQYDVDENFEFSLPEIEKLLVSEPVKLLVVTASSNLNGYCPDVKKIGEIAHRHGAYLLVDACQFLQHHKMDMVALGIDFLAASGHKFYAPYGSGFLIGPKKFLDMFLPHNIGGNVPYVTKDWEFLRYKSQLAHDTGTANAVGAVAMATALKQLKELGIDKVEAYEEQLTRRAFDYLKTNPRVQLYVSGERLSTIIPFMIKGMPPREVAESLNDDYGIGVRAGCFCVYQAVRKVLHGTDEQEREIVANVKEGKYDTTPGLVRASVSISNTEKDIDRFIAAIKDMTR